MKLAKVAVSFLKLGLIGFGGGSALIPVIEKEIVQNKKLVAADDFNDFVIVGNITPGAFPVKLAAACGNKVCGRPGLLVSSYAFALPGTLLTILLMSLLSVSSGNFLHHIEKASVGISAFIIFLLLMYILRVMKDARAAGFLPKAIIIMAVSATLTCGKGIRRILAQLFGSFPIGETTVFSIGVINLLIISFFVIFYLGGRWQPRRGVVAILLVSLYLSMVSGATLIAGPGYKTALALMMAVLAVWSIWRELRQSSGTGQIKLPFAPALISTGWFMGLILLAMLPPLLLLNAPEALWYTANGMLSTITSFGGGEAYLTVADGIFVSGGFTPSGVFYSQLLPIANALPGPILVKLLAGIGYIWGLGAAGQWGGWLAAWLGITMGVGVSCSAFMLVFIVYSSFSSLEIFKVLKQWILPVICGLLVSTMLSMLAEMLQITAYTPMSPFVSLAITGGIISLCWVLHKQFHAPDLLLIVISGIISFSLIAVVS